MVREKAYDPKKPDWDILDLRAREYLIHTGRYGGRLTTKEDTRTPEQVALANEIVERSYPFIKKLARNLIGGHGVTFKRYNEEFRVSLYFMRGKLDLDDLVQEGVLGVLENLHRYDSKKAGVFPFILHWATNAMRKSALEKYLGIVRIPIHELDAYRPMIFSDGKDFGIVQMVDFMELIKDRQISLEKGENVERIYNLLNLNQTQEIYSKIDGEFSFNNQYRVQNPSDLASMEEAGRNLEEVLSGLTKEEQTVIKGRFGLINGRKMTGDELGEILKLSRGRIFQIEQKVLRKLKDPKKARKLEFF